MLVYKIDVIQELKDKGYNSNRIRKEKLIGENAMQKLREGKMVGNIALDQICTLLQKQPGSIIKWVPDETEES